MVTLTRGIQVTPYRRRKERFLRALGARDSYYRSGGWPECRQEGIPVFNLAPIMAKQAIRDQVYFHAHQDSRGIGHWSEEVTGPPPS